MVSEDVEIRCMFSADGRETAKGTWQLAKNAFRRLVDSASPRQERMQRRTGSFHAATRLRLDVSIAYDPSLLAAGADGLALVTFNSTCLAGQASKTTLWCTRSLPPVLIEFRIVSRRGRPQLFRG